MTADNEILYLVVKTSRLLGSSRKWLPQGSAMFKVFRTRNAARLFARQRNKKAKGNIRYSVVRASWGPEQ